MNNFLSALKKNPLVIMIVVMIISILFQVLSLNVVWVVILDIVFVLIYWKVILKIEVEEEKSQQDLLFESLKESVLKLADASTAVANGKVGAKLPDDLEEELGVIATNISSMIVATTHIIKEIDDMSESSATTSRQLEDISTSTARVMDDLSATLQELTSTTLQLNSSVGEIADGANEIDELTKNGMMRLSNLEDKMSQINVDSNLASDRIMTLNQSAGEMDKIIAVITGIAKQTNLLALNAAIEAARAGDAGKGFAVVADEVRNLAASTQSSLEDIKGLIDEFTGESKEAVAIINKNNEEIEASSGILTETTKTFSIIAERIEVMVDKVKESSMATSQIASGSQEIASAATVQSESIAEIHGLSTELAMMSNEMKDALSDIQIGSGELELDLDEFDSKYSKITDSEKEALKREFDLKGQFLVGMIARLEENKGHDFFIESVLAIIKKHPKATVVIAGNGSLEHVLEQKIKALGVSDRIKMLGYRTDVMTILSILDMVVATSIKEGTPPRILLEAMAASKPIVSTDVVGAKALLKQSEHAILIQHGDQGALTDAIDKMISKPEVAKSLATKARAHIQELHDIK